MRALLVSLFIWTSAAQADDPPVDQAELGQWWKAAGQIWQQQDAYRADGTSFDGGVCRYTFDEGVLIPVFSGKKPLSERRIGMIFVGKGWMEVDFPDRGDAWSFANHMVLKADRDPDDFADVAAQKAPYRVPIENGFIVSGDPDVQRALLDLEPIGGGPLLTENSEGGVDYEIVVTDERTPRRVKTVATNLISQRRTQLMLSGISVEAMVRQDRFLEEVMGVDPDELRFIADFRTADHYRVAEPQAGSVGGGEHDRWLTCYRDPQGYLDSGFHTMVFAHGRDRNQVRHFRRFSGERLTQGEDGRLAQPPFMPVKAESEITAKTKVVGTTATVQVESALTFRATGGPRQALALSLPNWGTIPDTFTVESLTTEDGTDLARVGLFADLPRSGVQNRAVSSTSSPQGNDEVTATDVSEGDDAEQDAVDGAQSLSDGGQQDSSVDSEEMAGFAMPALLGQDDGPASFRRLQNFTQRQRLEVMTVLPEPVPEGEEVTIRLKWNAKYQYANMAVYDGVSTAVRSLGPSTGAQAYLPRLLPRTGLGTWEIETTVGHPGSGLRSLNLATTGSTIEEWTDADGWRWTRSKARRIRAPTLAIGKWKSYYDPRAMGMPAISVHLFSSQAEALETTPAQVRQTLDFYNRFLPKFPFKELDVMQAPGQTANETGIGSARVGTEMVALSTIGGTEDVAAGGGRRREAADDSIGQAMLAAGVANQYFGEAIQPASSRDRWITDGLADVYGMYYVRAVGKKDAFDVRMEGARYNLENLKERRREANGRFDVELLSMSLSGVTGLTDVPGNLYDDYQLVILGDMLRKRVGDEAYFRAIDQLAEKNLNGWVTTEGLQTAFEKNSGQDLSSYFDFWIHGGMIPRLQSYVRVNEADGQKSLQGCITTNIPFGHLEVPVWVDVPGEELPLGALVDVVDGLGTFEIPNLDKTATVNIDPEPQILSFERKVITKEWGEGCPATL